MVAVEKLFYYRIFPLWEYIEETYESCFWKISWPRWILTGMHPGTSTASRGA